MDRAVEASLKVKLVFPDAEIVLSDVRSTMAGDDWALIKGRVIDAPLKATQ